MYEREEIGMKKKIITLLSAGLILLSGSSIALAEDNSARIAEIESQISELQEELKELKTEARKNTIIEDNTDNIALYDDNGLKIGMTGLSSSSGISLYIENNSNLNLGVMPHAYAINGFMIGGNSYGFNSYDVASGKKANAVEEIDRDALDQYEIDSFETLDILFWAYDNDESFKSFDTNQIHVSLTDGAENALSISGETLYNNAGIKVDYLYSSGNEYTYCLTNTSGNYLAFTVENLTINDYTSSDTNFDLYDILVLNNCQIMFNINPDSDFLSANNISEITKVEFTLDINPMEEYYNEWNTDMITLEK